MFRLLRRIVPIMLSAAMGLTACQVDAPPPEADAYFLPGQNQVMEIRVTGQAPALSVTAEGPGNLTLPAQPLGTAGRIDQAYVFHGQTQPRGATIPGGGIRRLFFPWEGPIRPEKQRLVSRFRLTLPPDLDYAGQWRDWRLRIYFEPPEQPVLIVPAPPPLAPN